MFEIFLNLNAPYDVWTLAFANVAKIACQTGNFVTTKWFNVWSSQRVGYAHFFNKTFWITYCHQLCWCLQPTNFFLLLLISSHVGFVSVSDLLAIIFFSLAKRVLVDVLVRDWKKVLVGMFWRPQIYQNILCFGNSQNIYQNFNRQPFLQYHWGCLYYKYLLLF